jgi:lysophospholipase L1-like esterase
MATPTTNIIVLMQSVRVVRARSRPLLVKVALVVLSTAFALLLCEIALRLLGQGPLYVSPERNRFWKYDSRLGWVHQPGQEGVFATEQFQTFVRINQKGLRDREHTYERPDDSGRILVLGDSFAWGYGVEESERFSQLLESSLDVEVINSGVSGYSTDQELLWFQDEGIKYDFDLVILVFTGNDVGDNNQQHVYTIYYKPQFVQEEGQLTLKGYPVPRASTQDRLIYSLSQESALAFFLIQEFFELRSRYSSFSNGQVEQAEASPTDTTASGESFGLTLALLDEMRNTAESEGATFMIVANDSWWNNPTDETYLTLIEAMRGEGFIVLDVESSPGFDAEKMFIADDSHWNAAGHEFVANEIIPVIEANQLLSQPPD